MKTIEIRRHSIRSKPGDPFELYLAPDAGYITQEELKKAYDMAVEAKKLINGMISYLGKN